MSVREYFGNNYIFVFSCLNKFSKFGDFVINFDIKEQIFRSMIYTSKRRWNFQGNLSRRLLNEHVLVKYRQSDHMTDTWLNIFDEWADRTLIMATIILGSFIYGI